MEENLKWLWAAFSIAWAMHIGYLLLLSEQGKKLKNQLNDLQALLTEHSRPNSTREDS